MAFTTTSFSGVVAFGTKFDDLMTPFEYDATTSVATFSNFLGSTSTFSVKFNTPASQPNTFDSSVDAGFGEGSDYTGYPINGFTNPIALYLNGSAYCTLSDLVFLGGNYTQMAITETNNEKFFTFYFVFRGKYADESGTKDGMPQYIQMEASLPYVETPESGFENVAADENAPVEYFNLQGIRINEPAAGQIVIRRQGSKVSKIVVR